MSWNTRWSSAWCASRLPASSAWASCCCCCRRSGTRSLCVSWPTSPIRSQRSTERSSRSPALTPGAGVEQTAPSPFPWHDMTSDPWWKVHSAWTLKRAGAGATSSFYSKTGELWSSTNCRGVFFLFMPCLVLFLARILTKSFFYESYLLTCSADCILWIFIWAGRVQLILHVCCIHLKLYQWEYYFKSYWILLNTRHDSYSMCNVQALFF